ncbi:PAS domain S-box-containing protein [Kaistia hirudinis]|uniref:histidine kinase n=1 Tax=Kaistia hirudinis TaxID=1293440 RepID=A0A840AM93_9HYPH|nr:PAS domain-containing sensor histidine kinase [Kaistia hirudinis]MBB3930383.1 PAS domain S-box-containing protein [Kaistia hirudinis]
MEHLLDKPGLRADEASYRLLVESIADYAIYMLDTRGRVASWNRGAERIKGYAASEILGQHFSCFYSPEARAAGVPEAALAMAAREGRFESEGWLIRKGGAAIWAHGIIDPIRSETGELIGFASMTRDLTERRESADALERSEKEFRLLVESVTDYAIYRLDAAGRVATWNAGAQRIKGYGPEEIIGQSFARFYTPEDQAAGEPERTLSIARRDGRFEKEGWRVRKDGSRFLASVVVDPIRDPSGTIIGFAKVTRDVTERHAAQKALEEAREALFQSQKIEAIGQLTGGIAHDFNNLLMAILGSLDLLRKRLPDDPNILRLVDNATRGALRGSALTQRMLTFARRRQLETRAVEIPELVGGMAELLAHSIGPSIVIEHRFPARLPPVATDENQLESALINLVVNARDAMPDGGTVTITAREARLREGEHAALQAGSYVVLAIEDTGVGIAAETLARVQEPFFTTKGPGKGTGLGLPMVRALAEQSGGTLDIRSTVGRGTCVEIWLPVAVSQVKATVSAPDEAAAMRRLHVLAVDDDPLVLMNTEEMLRELGHKVEAVSSPATALERLRRGGFDLVVTDQAMPGMTGLQLADAMASEGITVPVVLATGYSDVDVGAERKVVALAKPFRECNLADAIAAALSGA